jgi:hypothetical protein
MMHVRPRVSLRVCLFTALLACAASTIAAQPRGVPFEDVWDGATPRTVAGVLTVVVADDFDGQRSARRHSLRDEQTNQTFELWFDQEPPAGLRSGTRVRMTGRVRDSTLLVAGCCDGTTGGSTVAAGSDVPVGDQRTLVMLANFTDAAVSCSVDAVNNAMFADPGDLSVSALYASSSLGTVTFSGQVAGPYVLDATSTDACDMSRWADEADAAASASGVDVAAYPRRVYVMPRNTCPGAGLGTVGGVQSSRSWIFDCATKGVFAHEIGHNLGLDHASTPTQEYGDGTDPMTVASWMLPGVNAPHRQALGWFEPGDVALVTASAVYQVAPMAAEAGSAGAPRVIMIPKPDTNEQYYLSYRTPVGFDRYIDSTYHYQLSVHRYAANGALSRTYLLAGLGDGRSFSDPANGITITHVSHDSAGATVRVEFASACVPVAPALTLSPQSQTAAAGGVVSYSVGVVNRDAAACPPRAFALSAVTPAAWTSAFVPASVTVPPGGTVTAVATVGSSPMSAEGTYTSTITAADAVTAAASAVAAYVVQPPQDSVPPTAPSGLAAAVNSKRKEIALSWSASSDDRGVVSYGVQRNGVTVGTSTTTAWVDRAWSAGAKYVYRIVAYDAAGNVSAPSGSVTVALGGGGKNR